jgi:hypothetical protein
MPEDIRNSFIKSTFDQLEQLMTESNTPADLITQGTSFPFPILISRPRMLLYRLRRHGHKIKHLKIRRNFIEFRKRPKTSKSDGRVDLKITRKQLQCLKKLPILLSPINHLFRSLL